MQEQALTIGQLAKSCGVGVETIRFYQHKGLLPKPPRAYGSIRRYGRETIARLKFIQAAKRLGFCLEEIGQLLKLEDGTGCVEARELAQHKLEDIRARLMDLKRMEGALVELLERCEQAKGQVRCPLIAKLQEATSS